MKKLMSIALLIGLIAFGSSCNKSEEEVISNTSSDYLVFGTYYGFCTGNCVNLYKLEKELLFQDDMDSMADLSDPIFGSTSLSSDKVELARQLLNDLPSSLQTEGGVHGCPNCVDQGAYYVQLIDEEGQSIEWHIDTDIEVLPAEVWNFVEEMIAVMEKL